LVLSSEIATESPRSELLLVCVDRGYFFRSFFSVSVLRDANCCARLQVTRSSGSSSRTVCDHILPLFPHERTKVKPEGAGILFGAELGLVPNSACESWTLLVSSCLKLSILGMK
jgi:hypothetical protein